MTVTTRRGREAATRQLVTRTSEGVGGKPGGGHGAVYIRGGEVFGPGQILASRRVEKIKTATSRDLVTGPSLT